MKNKIKNVVLVLTSLLTLYFGYSIFESPNNIEENVTYNVNPYSSEFQVLHSTKTFGTNYAILAQFTCSNDSITKVNFKLANFGGPINFYLKEVIFDSDTDFFTFDLGVSFFAKNDIELSKECSIAFNSGIEYDSHIRIHTIFGVRDETNFYDQMDERNLWCCGRMCRYVYTPIKTE